MCVIVYKPENEKITYKNLEKCFTQNPDGAGIMFPNAGKVVIVKGLMSWKEFKDKIARLNAVYNFEARPVVYHFRIKSAGDKTAENTHPFRINKELAYCHNGTINIETNKKGESDTSAFCRLVLKRLDQNVFDSPSVRYLLSGCLRTDKMVFMNGRGDIYIVNEKLGTKRGELWFSNTSWEYERHSYTYTTQTIGMISRQGRYGEYCFACGRTLEREEIKIYEHTPFCSQCYQHLNFPVLNLISKIVEDYWQTNYAEYY